MEFGKVEKVLTSLGLWKAVEGIPGLTVIVAVSIIILEILVSQVALPIYGISQMTLHFLIIVLGTFLGLIGYYAGNFWDSVVFDPLYSSNGKWLTIDRRPFNLFPAGSNLNRSRQKAIAVLGQTGGTYETARTAMSKTAKWKTIEQPLILSKFVRGLIWPCVILVLLSIVGLLGYLPPIPSQTLWLVGVMSFGCGLLSFIPYMHLRVEHMIRLYESVSDSKS